MKKFPSIIIFKIHIFFIIYLIITVDSCISKDVFCKIGFWGLMQSLLLKSRHNLQHGLFKEHKKDC